MYIKGDIMLIAKYNKFDQCVEIGIPEQPRTRVARLAFGGDGSNFYMPEPQGGRNTREASILVQTGSLANVIGKT